MQNRRVEIVQRMNVLDRFNSKLVGQSMADSLAYTDTGHPAGEPIGIVVATLGPFLEKGHSTEFGAPNDQRVVEQPARSEVIDQCGYGLIEDRCVDIALRGCSS